ncbi:MAG TPA: type VII secretion protein EccC, partial [Nocardioides sp.]|nr:type VII secretion protein EccC [Nocardioides sp.]
MALDGVARGTTPRAARRDEHELPTGQLVLRAPPQIQQHEGAGGVLLNAIPMLGSLGSIVLVATMGPGTDGRSYIAAGMFLLATVGFVVVQLDRQQRQRRRQVTGSRTGYLRYLGHVRQVAREAAEQQRRVLSWHHPEPAVLPALAEERSRVWERDSSDADFLHVRYGACDQPLSVELVPPESAPTGQADPAATSALHRLLTVHRLQPDLPATIDLRAFDRIELCGPEEQVRGLARAMLCSAAAFHAPEHLVIAVLATERKLAHWDWLKWLPHAQSAQHSDAVGPSRLVATSTADLAAMLPQDLTDRPRSGAEERLAPPHLLVVTDSARLTPGNRMVPPDGLPGATVLDLPTRREGLESPTALRVQLGNAPADEHLAGRGSEQVPVLALRLHEEPIRARADQCDLSTAQAFARRLAPLHTAVAPTGASSGEITGRGDLTDLLGLGDFQVFVPATA